ncbi:hypothetical protein KAW96_10035 [candidate division WOR-3 bacterium]|nr:hypothetical protein [candidate division WOR-3 bacterium]
MVRIFISLCVILALFGITVLGTPGLCMGDVDVSGNLELDKRFLTTDSVRIANYPYHELDLKLKSNPSQNLSLYSSLKLRLWDQNLALSSADLTKISSNNPYELFLWEAYVDLYSFIFDRLDLRIGKQRIAWGTADKLNPTDNLNPDDFSDPLNFGEKVPTEAGNAIYYITDEYALNVIWLPSFKPILLPSGEFPLLGDADISPLPQGTNLVESAEHLAFPDRKLENSMFATKLSGKVVGFDFSLSYFKGYDDVPIANRLVVTPVDTLGNVRVDTYLGFPEMQVVGFDCAGEFSSVGLWGEVAVFLTDEVKMEIEMPNPADPLNPIIQDITILSDEPYVKFTLGGDYTFKNGIYINAQWMHGFFTERGKDNLEDYCLAGIEKKFKNDEIKIALSGGLEIKDTENIKENHGTVIIPEVSYAPTDNVKLSIGAFFLDGKPGTLFGGWMKQDQIYLKTEVSF